MTSGEDEEIFSVGEAIVLTLKDGRHYLGELIGYWDDGLGINLFAKTAYRVDKAENTAFRQLVENKTKDAVQNLFSPKDWIERYRTVFQGQNKVMWVNTLPFDVLKAEILSHYREMFEEQTRKIWSGPIQEQDVTKPYLRELKRSVRTMVAWRMIDEVCSANEMAEEAEIADLSNLLENGEFHKLIENENEGET